MQNDLSKLTPEDVLKEEAKFLDRDFTQCFLQMRHYDSQSLDVCKFAFTAYTALVGLATTLYSYGISQHTDYSTPAAATLFVGLSFGICFFSFIVRNRVYFVVVTRYINEHRRHFLRKRPLGFENHSKMYDSLDQPPYFNWRSSQALLLYVLSWLNGFLLASAIHFLYFIAKPQWTITIGAGVCFTLLQLTLSIWYLKARENKGASRAVHGHTKT